MLLIILMLI